jgi:hypothetical protein
MGFWCVAEERIVKLFFPADSKGYEAADHAWDA